MDLIKVKVGELSTFVEELTADNGEPSRGIVDKIVRVYYFTKPNVVAARVLFRAGYRSGDDYVYLEMDLGDVYTVRDANTHPGAPFEADIRAHCDALGLDFRHGIVEL